MPKYNVTLKIAKKTVVEIEAKNKRQASIEALKNTSSINLEDITFTVRKIEEVK